VFGSIHQSAGHSFHLFLFEPLTLSSFEIEDLLGSEEFKAILMAIFINVRSASVFHERDRND
jgi:hypothetical protein